MLKMASNSNNLIVVAAIFLTISTCTLAACNNQDTKALLAFQAWFGITYWAPPSPSDDCCYWMYMTCNKGRVTHWTMWGDDVPLNGSLPAVLGDLTALEELSFIEMPNLVGPIPPQLSNLKRLKTLVLRGKLSGPVPSFLSQMPSLEVVDFRNNMFTGTIPPSLGKLENLNSLTLFANQLSGTIPSTLFSRAKKGNIFLYLSSNKLTGDIPRSFDNVDFANFYADNNQLTGDASVLLGKNKKMGTLILNNNKLAFDLTNVEYPKTLTYLTISHNKIYGSISNQITEVPNLGGGLDVSYNELCGEIPSGGYFKNNSADSFAHNKCLCGTPLPPCK